jgi:hypothetical protein
MPLRQLHISSQMEVTVKPFKGDQYMGISLVLEPTKAPFDLFWTRRRMHSNAVVQMGFEKSR